MLQHSVLMTLWKDDLGASLQGYNPVIDEPVKEMFNLPENWKLVAQISFGRIIEDQMLKKVYPINERVKIFK